MRIKDWGYTVAVLGVCFLLMCGCDSRSDEGLSLSNGPDAVYLDRSRWQGLCCRLTMWGLSIKLTRYL